MRELYHKFFATNKSREEYFWFEANRHHQSVDKVRELRNNMLMPSAPVTCFGGFVNFQPNIILSIEPVAEVVEVEVEAEVVELLGVKVAEDVPLALELRLLRL